jgi:hypothetical protein
MTNGDHTGHHLALYPSLGQCGTYRSYKHVSPLRQWLDGASGEGTPHRDKAVSTVTKRRSLDERGGRINSLEAMLRREREHGWRESTVSWYMEGWLEGEDPDEGGHAFEIGEGLVHNGVAPNGILRLRMLGGTGATRGRPAD